MNFNGTILSKNNPLFYNSNRAFKYGDALFETIKVINLKVIFLEDHYFRLMASLRMLRMEIPMNFTLEFFQTEIEKTVEHLGLQNARVRVTVFREDGGLYLPKKNSVNYLIEAENIVSSVKSSYEIDIYKDFYVYSGLLSTIKSTNKLTNVLASIYASENKLDNCILLNENKNVTEVINGNIFIVKGNTIKTPSISEGCVKGIIRKKTIEIIEKLERFLIIEGEISPFDLQKADELFITNAIIGIQSITKYKKNEFSTKVAAILADELRNLI